MKKALLYLCLVLLVVIAVAYYNYSNKVTSTNNSVSTPSASWQPAHLLIPRLHINASVLSVGKTASGLMDAPSLKPSTRPTGQASSGIMLAGLLDNPATQSSRATWIAWEATRPSFGPSAALIQEIRSP